MEFQMFEILDMRLSLTEEELKQLRLEILAAYPTELAHLSRPKPPHTPPESKNSRPRSPDVGDLPKRKRAKFVVEDDEESDGEYGSDFESDESYYRSELEDSYIYPSPPQLSSSASSSSSTSSIITPPDKPSMKLVRSRATANLRAGFKLGSSPYSPRIPFSPTIEVPMLDPYAAVGKSSAAGWQFLQWVKSSPWTSARR